jgi:hypothetical protein
VTFIAMLRRSDLYLGVLIAGLVFLHGSLFLTGYRLTADDVEFHYQVMNGISNSWQFVKSTAITQGRIVHFIDLPVSMLGAYYADNVIFRVFYTAIYFTNFLLIGKYVSMISGVRSGLFMVLVLVSFHPLDYFHLAPNSYPFHVSLPIILILLSRIALWKIRRINNENSKTVEWLWLSLCFVGMSFSEYGFIFSVALIGTEFLTRVITRWVEKGRWMEALIHWLHHQYVKKDFAIVLGFIMAYFGFRFLFPSAYSGNKITDNFQFFIFFKTLFGHIYGGTSIASLVRGREYFGDFLSGLGYVEWGMVASVLFGTFFASVFALVDLKKKCGAKELIYRYWLIAGIGLFFAVIVTIPVAIVAKYQSWCVDINACAFVDSRISYLGVGVFIAALIFGVVSSHSGNRSSKAVIMVFISVALAIFGALTFLNNLRIRSDMNNFVSGFERANKMACLSDDDLHKISSSILSFIEPVPRINFHPGFNINKYWIDYINSARRRVDCDGQEYRISDFFPPLNVGEKTFFIHSGGGVNYLLAGWSASEVWGTWSEGEMASVFLPLPTKRANAILIEAKPLISQSHQKQRVELVINGVLAAELILTETSGGMFEVKIPEEVKQKTGDGFLKLEFHFPDAARPKDIGLGDDSRKLALGLVALTVR